VSGVLGSAEFGSAGCAAPAMGEKRLAFLQLTAVMFAWLTFKFRLAKFCPVSMILFIDIFALFLVLLALAWRD